MPQRVGGHSGDLGTLQPTRPLTGIEATFDPFGEKFTQAVSLGDRGVGTRFRQEGYASASPSFGHGRR